MIDHRVQWTAPSPLWPEVNSGAANTSLSFRQPAIFRFATDSFMDDFVAILKKDPYQIKDLIAQGENWQNPTPTTQSLKLLEPQGPVSKAARMLEQKRLIGEREKTLALGPLVDRTNATSGTDGPPQQKFPLKLYQPSQMRYYLVSACLICRPNGLGDHRLHTQLQERVGFVIRRLFPKDDASLDISSWVEHAFVKTPSASGWQKVDAEASSFNALVAGEEQLSLFPVMFPDKDATTRRIFSGLIPVGKRETYIHAATLETAVNAQIEAGTRKTSRKVLLLSQVIQPWQNIIAKAASTAKLLGVTGELAGDNTEKAALKKSIREQVQTISWYMLIDFADYIQKFLQPVWDKISGKTVALSDEETALFSWLNSFYIPTNVQNELTINNTHAMYKTSQVNGSLADALKNIGAWKDGLELTYNNYNRDNPSGEWPTFLFPLADPAIIEFSSGNPALIDFACAAQQKLITKIVGLVMRALPLEHAGALPPLPLAAQNVKSTREAWFVIRCVFERPNCGPLQPQVLSERTQAFQMASFFDPDAPARPIRIPLPIDTTPAGLRKFDKNTVLMISDALCGQINRIKGLSFGDLVCSVLPWPFHKDISLSDTGPCKTGSGNALGMMCSLSIPIVTLCALILLIIIVTLLDFIFGWLPYLIMCFPIFGFKAKKDK